MICNSNSWSRSSGEEEEEEEVRSQEEEEEKFCWVWRAKLTILVALRRIFLHADLLIATFSLPTLTIKVSTGNLDLPPASNANSISAFLFLLDI